MNVGFLLAYESDLRSAIRNYRQALLQSTVPAEVIGKIEDFMLHVATAEPQKYQLYYCLGFLNWKFKGDLVQAAADFSTFIAHRREGEFAKEVELTNDG